MLMTISSIAAASAARKPCLATACVCAEAGSEPGTARNTNRNNKRRQRLVAKIHGMTVINF